jgi:hypothetical protein
MSLFMVRRTRSFIRDNYAKSDHEDGRRYLLFADGQRAYFPFRHPKRISFTIDEANSHDQYARLYASDTVDIISNLNLPRYGLGNYLVKKPKKKPTVSEQKIMDNLSRGGRRLMGFSRTNLFKRLESSGQAFLLSVERHILRNYVFIHALENGLPLPIGTQGAEMLDPRFEDGDAEAADYNTNTLADDDSFDPPEVVSSDDFSRHEPTETDTTNMPETFKQRAATIYDQYTNQYKGRFKWVRSDLFQKKLLKDLENDALAMIAIRQSFGQWDVAQDSKLNALYKLLTETHTHEKVLIFSQFADTVHYLTEQLQARGLSDLAGVTGGSADPTALAWRFSPVSNSKLEQGEELRILIATDVLSEGQNLQDCAIVVNYDLPWAIIRLIQRVGRIDRIGQQAGDIMAYTFWPADGVERIIRLRERLQQRLQENAEVIGTDEAFFEDEATNQPLVDLYHEKAGILDDELDTEVDLVSHAYQIWKNGTDANPRLKNIIPNLPIVSYATKEKSAALVGPAGVLVYLNTGRGNSALAWLDQNGQSVTESQFDILRAAECSLDTPAQPRQENHHELVECGIDYIIHEQKTLGGQLGRPSGARFKSYQRLKKYITELQATLFAHETEPIQKALDELFRYPLREAAKTSLNRQLRSNINDADLANLVVNLHQDERLCLVQQAQELEDPQIICSMGLTESSDEK